MEVPTLLEAILEPLVADNARSKPPRNVILLTLKPLAHLWHPVENRASNLKPRGNKSVSCEGAKGVVYYQVGEGSAHGTDVARSSLRDELDESMSLVAVVAAHGRNHIPHPFHHRHGDAASLPAEKFSGFISNLPRPFRARLGEIPEFSIIIPRLKVQ
ncbi:hypothetical protein GUJ93_ZPchr0011g28029 [Zizania palustris]|uniref:Uncharacterized protein n=1 Tax=Zizania palustris TaxID=103762 RepID=A0A8J5WLN9_ZIZPA|nr:hypothetical protein GUJ93_ZPchr0011g28029 [Zizania palustris]